MAGQHRKIAQHLASVEQHSRDALSASAEAAATAFRMHEARELALRDPEGAREAENAVAGPPA